MLVHTNTQAGCGSRMGEKSGNSINLELEASMGYIRPYQGRKKEGEREGGRRRIQTQRNTYCLSHLGKLSGKAKSTETGVDVRLSEPQRTEDWKVTTDKRGFLLEVREIV